MEEIRVFESCGSNKMFYYMHNYQHCRCYEGWSNYYDKKCKQSVTLKFGRESVWVHWRPSWKCHLYCNSQDGTFVNLSKGCLTSSTEINICCLNYVLPNPSICSEFLTTNKIKFYLFSLLLDIITSEHLATDKRLFVTKGKFSYINETKVLY